MHKVSLSINGKDEAHVLLKSQLKKFLRELTMGETSKHAITDSHSRNILWANFFGSTAKSNPEMGKLEFVLALNKSCERMKKQGNFSGLLPQLLKVFFRLDNW